MEESKLRTKLSESFFFFKYKENNFSFLSIAKYCIFEPTPFNSQSSSLVYNKKLPQIYYIRRRLNMLLSINIQLSNQKSCLFNQYICVYSNHQFCTLSIKLKHKLKINKIFWIPKKKKKKQQKIYKYNTWVINYDINMNDWLMDINRNMMLKMIIFIEIINKIKIELV